MAADVDAEAGAKDIFDPRTSLLAASDSKPAVKSSRHTNFSFSHCAKRFIISFLTGYLLAAFFFHFYSARDPTSYFFNETLGYEARYSKTRSKQASQFIESVNNGTLLPSSQRTLTPKLCIAVPTVARPGGEEHQYVRSTIGSLLDGLSVAERAELHLILFIAHMDTHIHPIYGERWTHVLPDQILFYDRSGRLEVAPPLIQRWEDAGAYIPKGLFDYAVALDACAVTGAPLVGVMEGDVLAARGWMTRALRAAAAIAAAENDLSLGAARSTDHHRWLYLRLFYTETYLGWNREFWPAYLGHSLLSGIALLALLLALRRRFGSRMVSGGVLTFALGVALPASLALVFLAGRLTMLPPSPGVAGMDQFGCCSQALLFPSEHAPWLVAELRANWEAASAALVPGLDKDGNNDREKDSIVDDDDEAADVNSQGTRTGYIPYVDMLLEHLAATRHMSKYATVPSLVQHMGRASSKGDPIADSRARKIWSFAFEGFDGEEGVRHLGWTEGIGTL